MRNTLLRKLAMAGLLSLPALAVAGSPTWRELPNAPAPEAGRHEDIYFIDDVTGWVVNFRGQIFKTTNGGISWTTQVDTLEAFRSVAFATPQRGWVGSVFDVNLLFETFDGGDTWSVVPNIPEPRPAGICGLFVVNPSVIYGCGQYSGPARVIKSVDGGATWESKDLAPLADTAIDCYFVSPDSGFVVGGVGSFPNDTRTVVLSTGDGGDTWQTRFQGTLEGEWGWKISFPTPLVGYVSIEEFFTIPRFLKTTDGGASWTTGPFPNAREQGVGFTSAVTGWIGGDTNVVYYTEDGGASWSPQTWGSRINRMIFRSEKLGYAVGDGVYKYSIDPAPTAVPAVFEPSRLEQNSPNPFNPTTLIKYYVQEGGPTRLRVFNASGALVRTLREEYLPPGEYAVEWDGRDEAGVGVASGLYYYRLDTEQFAEVKRMVLLK